MKKFLITALFLCSIASTSFGQSIINIHAVTTTRQALGDGGYTLNGLHMIDSRAKLLNTNNFGPGATYEKDISITDGYGTAGSLASISSVPNVDLFYFGIFNNGEPSLIPFTNAEVDSLYEWSLRGGKLIIGAASPIPSFPFLPNILDAKWDFSLALAFPSPVIPTAAGTNSILFDGPFGIVPTAMQGGGSQGYFITVPSDIVVLADDGNDNETIFLDCHTLDLVVADGDIYTDLGGISSGLNITSNNDVLWANTIAYMDTLQDPPAITVNGNNLSTGTYSSYQWLLNGTPIPGATSSTYVATQAGSYTVEVDLDCGCSDVSSPNTLVVGIDEFDYNTLLSVYPSPAANDISIKGLEQVPDVNYIEIRSLKGALVRTIDSVEEKIDVSDLTQGIYMLNIYLEDGLARLKFVKD